MSFHPIDFEAWPRREHYRHYLDQVPCYYSMTVELDVTRIKEENRRLFPTLLYALAKVVNRRQEFRMALDEAGTLGYVDCLSPLYTVFHPETETFSCLWTEYAEDYGQFLRQYQEDLRRYGETEGFLAKPDPPAEVFSVSMLPWQTFTSFHLELPKGQNFQPIFTLGRYRPVEGKLLMPLALQVHHAVCDGFHACRFVEEVQALLDGEL